MVLSLRNVWPKERSQKNGSKEVILVNTMTIYKIHISVVLEPDKQRDLVFVGLMLLETVENEVYYLCFMERNQHNPIK